MPSIKSPFSPSRKLSWVSSVLPENRPCLDELQLLMRAYYQNAQYYSDIVPATRLWQRLGEEPLHADLIKRISGKMVLEIGCGRAEVLSTGLIDENKYSGCDFSNELMVSNSNRFTKAVFRSLSDCGRLPYEDESFEAVFSLFVLEHAVFPKVFLEESLRVLAPGGLFVLLCPDFLGRNRISSQRVGHSLGSGREKLRSGKIIDAVLTCYDQRFRIPKKCRSLRKNAAIVGGFYVNIAPVCFTETEFRPDVDAVYLTYEKEIRTYLSSFCRFVEVGSALAETAHRRRLIYLVGYKFE